MFFGKGYGPKKLLKYVFAGQTKIKGTLKIFWLFLVPSQKVL